MPKISEETHKGISQNGAASSFNPIVQTRLRHKGRRKVFGRMTSAINGSFVSFHESNDTFSEQIKTKTTSILARDSNTHFRVIKRSVFSNFEIAMDTLFEKIWWRLSDRVCRMAYRVAVFAGYVACRRHRHRKSFSHRGRTCWVFTLPHQLRILNDLIVGHRNAISWREKFAWR